MSNAHTGNLDRIKSRITLHGPQTVGDLMKALGLKDHQVRPLLSQAMSRTGGIVHAGRRAGIQLYGLPGIHAPKPKEYPKRYEHKFIELKRDPFQHRDLALAGR